MSSTGCLKVVSGGRQASAAVLSSKPTTLRSAGMRRPRRGGDLQRALRHQVVGDEQAVDGRVVVEQPGHGLLAALLGEVAGALGT